MQGWIKLHRCLKEKAIWQNSSPEHKTILITLLMMANHEEKQWEWNGGKFVVKPGQFVTSLESIRKKAGKGISIKNIRSALKRFEKLEFLANETAKAGRLITIVNWGVYQGEEKKGAKQRAKRGQRGGKEGATNNNDNNDNNKRSSSSKIFADDSKEFLLAAKLKKLILQNNSKSRTPDNLQNWAHEIDLMIRIDNRTPEEIEAMIDFSQKDSFWSTNILSVGTLRKQFDKLYLQSKQKEKSSPYPREILR